MATDLTQQSSHAVDLHGLSPDAVRIVQSLIGLLRKNGQHVAPNQSNPDQWAAEWQTWTASQPKRVVTLDDDRDSIYAGCGE
jgi:hypothetical protein